jgi:hypothetical protein
MKILFLIAAFGLTSAIHAQDETEIPAADDANIDCSDHGL